jgi:hypothetical protein
VSAVIGTPSRDAESNITDRVAVERIIRLRADVESTRDDLFDCLARAIECHRASFSR